jgi:hypothetical protein
MPSSKDYILEEIRRLAGANGGRAPGVESFCAETGIRREEIVGRHWVRWSDAVQEAGLRPNVMTGRRDDAEVASKLAALIRRLGHYPVKAELQLARRDDPDFPHVDSLRKRGGVAELVARWCESVGGFDDVAAICSAARARATKGPEEKADAVELGDVYLLRSGRFYKVGRSNAAGRRGRELAIQLPERATVVHVIKTDDPVGIEAYWHRRFEDRRKNGEWFQLTAADVSAFRRRRFM